MSKIIYSDCNISIDESNAEILINPKWERFYSLPCDSQGGVFSNAALSLDEDGKYCIEGTQQYRTEHRGLSLRYDSLLCEHPAELIRKRSFLGFVWYEAIGEMIRELRVRYLCKHASYTIHERLEILSHEYIKGV